MLKYFLIKIQLLTYYQRHTKHVQWVFPKCSRLFSKSVKLWLFLIEFGRFRDGLISLWALDFLGAQFYLCARSGTHKKWALKTKVHV